MGILFPIAILLIVALLIALTVLPAWLRRRRMGLDYDQDWAGRAIGPGRKDRSRTWDELDHTPTEIGHGPWANP